MTWRAPSESSSASEEEGRASSDEETYRWAVFFIYIWTFVNEGTSATSVWVPPPPTTPATVCSNLPLVTSPQRSAKYA